MRRVALVLLPLSLLIALPRCAAAQYWTPPEGPDLVHDLPIDYLSRGVVMIQSTWYDDFDGSIVHQERGAGIILGFDRWQLFVMTAHHVVRRPDLGGANHIAVSFRDGLGHSVPATLFEYDPELDFAALRTGIISDRRDQESVVKLPVNLEYHGRPNDIVKSIGHPAGRNWYAEDSRLISRTGSGLSAPQVLSFNRGSLDGGSSGGPLFGADHRMIGMVTATEGDVAYGLRLAPMLERLEEWDIPYRERFPSNVAQHLIGIRDAVWTHEADGLKGEPIENRFTQIHQSRISIFGGIGAICTDEDFGPSYYVEVVGQYYFDEAVDEAWRVVVRSLAGSLGGYRVTENERYDVTFSRFKVFKGTIRVRAWVFSKALYVIIYRSETNLSRGSPSVLPSYIRNTIRDVRR